MSKPAQAVFAAKFGDPSAYSWWNGGLERVGLGLVLVALNLYPG